jgi:hypothetical protein
VNPVSSSPIAASQSAVRSESLLPESTPHDVFVEAPCEGVDSIPVETAEVVGGQPAGVGPTLLLDWDRERYPGSVPRRVPLPVDAAGPSWLAYPHQRYVLSLRHKAGSVESVYVTSLLGKRDSLIPGGVVERIVTDDRSVTVVVNGRPYLYAVENGSTLDLIGRRVLGGTQA